MNILSKIFLPFIILLISLNIVLFSVLQSEEERLKKSSINISFEKAELNIDENTVEVILVGDVMLGRSVMIESLEKEKNPNYPFIFVSDLLKSADLVFANLENPIINNCPRFEHGFTFCAKPEMVSGLIYSGIDIVTLANNHSGNFGTDGINKTQKYLANAVIGVVGFGNLLIKEVEGVKFGFLGFDFLTKEPSPIDYELIKDSKSKVDILLVGIHWGVEYKSTPEVFQREWAKKIIESGADVIAGHHPHWVQTVEYINEKLVFYSLGNFVFDQMWSEETKKGLLVRLIFKNGDLVGEERLNTYINKIGQPVIQTNN